MSFILVFLYLFLSWWIIRKDPLGLYNPLTILVYSLFIYRFSFIFNVLFLDNTINIPLYIFHQNLFLINTFLIGLIITNFNFINKKHKWKVNLQKVRLNKYHTMILYIFLITGLLLYSLFLIKAYGSILNVFLLETRADIFLQKRGFGVLEFGSYFIIIGFTGLTLIHFIKNNGLKIKNDLPLFILLIIYILFFLIGGERGEIVKVLLPVLGAYAIVNGLPKKLTLLFAPIGVLFMHFLSILRSYNIKDISYSLIVEILKSGKMNPAKNGELLASTNVDVNILTDLAIGNLNLKYGLTYFESIFSFLPSFFYSNRPELLTEWYVRNYDYNVYNKGGGLAFSIISEGIVNFGYLGGILGGIITGALVCFITKYMRQIDKPFFNILLGLVTLSFCFLLQRSGIGPMLKVYLFGAFIPLFIINKLFVKYLNNKR